jgi:methyl-accepting chemotaxis protein
MLLRRKLVWVFGSLVALLLALAIGAIWTLQEVLRDLRHLDTEAWVVIEQTNSLATSISMVEIELYNLEVGQKRHLDQIIDLVEAVQTQLARVEGSTVANLPENAPALNGIRSEMPNFRRYVSALATAQDPELANLYQRHARSSAIALRRDILALSRSVGSHGQTEQAEIISKFRWLVLGLTLVFLLVINISIIALLRMAGMVLRPVEKLIEGTRQLARERFDYRVELDQKDEFDELATAYNNLAGQLQANEQRKLEMLQQVAATLNHELNNATAIIEMQLELAGRQSATPHSIDKCAGQIRESLNRMTRSVELLKHVRRIVLTDYVTGVKMLDLERSASEEEIPPAPAEHHNQPHHAETHS